MIASEFAELSWMIARGRFGAGVGLAACVLVLGTKVPSALADSFYLSTGEVIEGTVVAGTINTLTLATSGSVQLTSIGLIERVELTLADGSKIEGELLGWKGGVFELRSAGNIVRIADGKLIDQAVTVAKAPVDDPVDKPVQQVITMQSVPSFTMVNGETLSGEILHATGSILTLKLLGGFASPISRAQVQSVSFEIEDGTRISGDFLGWQDGVYRLQLNDREVLASRSSSAVNARPKADPVEITTVAEPVEGQLETPIATEIEQADAAILPPVDVEATSEADGFAIESDVGAGGPAPDPATVAELTIEETSELVEPSSLGDQHLIETLVDPVDEGSEVVVFRFELDKPASRPLVVLYAATEATAKAGEDFEAKSGVITFSSGSTYAEVEVPIIDDDQGEESERFNLFLSGDPKSIAFSQRQVAVTINDND
ncbi:MAG: Calx-beta domain-containing protein [Pseudomonadota bacterium]